MMQLLSAALLVACFARACGSGTEPSLLRRELAAHSAEIGQDTEGNPKLSHPIHPQIKKNVSHPIHHQIKKKETLEEPKVHTTEAKDDHEDDHKAPKVPTKEAKDTISQNAIDPSGQQLHEQKRKIERKIERQAQWAERLERHEIHGNRSRAPIVDTKLQADVRKVTGKTGPTACAKNTFLVDWGSTGAKLFLAHQVLDSNSNAEFTRAPSDKVLIKDWLHKGTTREKLDNMILTLSGELTQAQPMMAALATAGNRLERAGTKQTWDLLRAANKAASPQLFQGCDDAKDLGCRTLPGADEAKYEFEVARGGDVATAAGERGMVSAGGASLQLSFEVPAGKEVEASRCVHQLNCRATDSEKKAQYIERAAEYRPEDKLITLSWLSVRKENEESDLFEVGGMNEMKASFDIFWLKKKGKTVASMDGVKHPCMKGAWPTREHEGWMTGFTSATDNDGTATTQANTHYLESSRGDYITMLPGDDSATEAGCTAALKEFVAEDFMVKKFLDSPCKGLAENVKDWKFLTSFYYAFGEMGQWTTKTGEGFKSGYAAYKATNPLTSQPATSYAEYYTRELLYQVLDTLNVLTSTDKVEVAQPAEWLVAAGKNLPTSLAPGWLTEDCSLPA